MFRAEQGGSEITLRVRARGEGLHVDREYREPGLPRETTPYDLELVDPTSAATTSRDAYLRQTTEGVLFWERSSGEEGIPAGYWSHCIRR